MNDKSIECKKTVCPLDCPDSCGLIATVEDGRVVSLSGDPDHPYTRGVICRKMKYYPQRLYSEKRIYHPMKRLGMKGDGRFERISWDEAYSILCDKIGDTVKRFGGESILPYAYAGNMGVLNRFAGYPLFHKLGTSRLIETICSAAAKAGWRSSCGDVPGTPPEVAEHAEVIIIWGSNTKATNMHFWPYVARARKKGAKLVVIDPYCNATAKSADLHLKVAPGGDAALALAVLQVLIARNGVDRSFIEHSTTGFEKLERYLSSTPPDEFFAASKIDKTQIGLLAELLFKKKKIFLRIGIGMTRNSRAGLGIRAITSLAAALGLFDGGTGRGVLMTSGAFSGDTELLTWPSLAEKATRRFNMVQLANCLNTADPPIKLLFVYNANPLSASPDGSLVRQALMNKELFTVVHEQVMTPTAKYADLLLPATTFLENKDMYTGYGHFYMSCVDAVVPPVAEAKSNFTLFRELAHRLGFDETPFGQTLDERMAGFLNSLDGLPERIRKEGLRYGEAILSTRCNSRRPVFPHNGRRFSFVQEDQPSQPGIACLKKGDEFDNDDYLARFPFKLITPPHRNLLNSTFGERYEGYPGEVYIHPDDADNYGVIEGEVLTLYNERGWARRVAKITDATQKSLLVAEGLFWQSVEHPTAINDLTSQKITDMGGGGTFHESRVALLNHK